MAVAYYQIFIAFTIIVCSITSPKAFWICIMFWVLWTISLVHTGELFFVQITTVIVSSLIGKKVIATEARRTAKHDNE